MSARDPNDRNPSSSTDDIASLEQEDADDSKSPDPIQSDATGGQENR